MSGDGAAARGAAGEAGGETLPRRQEAEGQQEAEALPVIDSVTDYEKLQRVGEGTFGVVYKARDRRTGEIVALKKLRMDRERDGMPVTSVRELRVLQTCCHPNLVQLKRVVTGSKLDSVFLVFEYCPHDLGRLIDSKSKPFQENEVKCLLQQLLAAVAYLHDHWVMHRDLKLSNLLLTHDGQLKLCDYGLARYFHPGEECYTPGVVTLWYRAPEVLLGSEQYTQALDCWSLGCIFAELLRSEPLFPGRSESAMLDLMTAVLGAPNERIWPGFPDLPMAGKVHLRNQPYSRLKQEFPELSEQGLDLLNCLLTYDPDKRITARQALKHPYFSERPLPKLQQFMPTFPSAHDGDGGGRRGRQRGAVEAEQEQRAQRMKRRQEDDRFGDAFGGGGPPRRPAVLRRLD